MSKRIIPRVRRASPPRLLRGTDTDLEGLRSDLIDVSAVPFPSQSCLSISDICRDGGAGGPGAVASLIVAV